MHTPGHTEGSVTYLLDGEAAFTGDFLFIDSIGRPDLAGKTEEWAKLLWKSIERTRAQLAPGLVVYPAHYSSDQERRADRTVGASLRDLLRRNGGLQPKDLDSFLSWIESRIATFPEAYRKIKAINVGLLEVGEDEALELESGKHECGLGSGPTLPEIIYP
jgi:glyoxylase-like metal-dependent hydrolase (beta-lactamase superfamily II)